MMQPDPGFWLERPNPAALEIAAQLGFRVCVLDLEHGAIAPDACDGLVALGRASGLTVIVRVAAPERILVQQALDYGAEGVMIPMARNAAHAATVSRYAKYAPLGTRGVGSGRAFAFGAYQAIDPDFFAEANARTRCHVMIETAEALEEVEAIAALPTVDGLFIGPSDLSLARGRGSFRFSAADEDDFRRVARACRSRGKVLGLPAASLRAWKLAREEGASYVTLSDDLTALRIGFAQGLAVLKEDEAKPQAV
jgi:2-dehydro-3-deoxyglucarate aldolase/4-hydroxy-2-oxoheptanedioate aldolase